MKSMKFFATIAVAVTAVLALSSFVSRDVSALNNGMATDIHSHAHVQGKHCNGTVGCDCSGFSAITNHTASVVAIIKDVIDKHRTRLKRCGSI